MPSTVVNLLAQLSEAELREMLSKLETEQARVTVEVEQVTEALSRKTRRSGARPTQRSTHRPARPGATQKRILEAVASSDGPISPAQIIAAMEAKGTTPSRGSIHNTIGRLVKNGLLTRLGEGQYQLASREDSDSGPSRNGEGPPRSMADPNHSRT
jgi:predicted HTH transcriptional regulator